MSSRTATPSPRIVFVVNSLEGGGAERVMSILASRIGTHLPGAGITLLLLDDRAVKYPVAGTVDVVTLDGRGSFARSAVQVAGFVRRARPALLVSFLNRSNCAAILAGRLHRVPVVVSERVHTSSHFAHGLSGRVNRWIVRLLYPRADRVVAVSRGVADDLETRYGVRPERIEIIDNPVDRDAILAASRAAAAIDLPDDFLVGAGRLVRNKNFPLLLRAFAASGVAGSLVILGDGPDRDGLRRLAEELGIRDRLLMPGHVGNPHAVMARARAFVSSSNAEGFPNALVEAMVLGLPVVATDCQAGPAEILAGRRTGEITATTCAENGILVPVDDVGRLAEALRLIGDPATAGRYAQRAREKAAQFSVDATVARYAALAGSYLDEPVPSPTVRRGSWV